MASRPPKSAGASLAQGDCRLPTIARRVRSATMTVEVLKPIRKRSAEAQASDALRAHILGGGARPGSRLTEIGLSQQLRLSRSTIRTALHQLANEGLVVQVPYTDWQVASLSGADARELYTLRASLEALGMRLAVGALTQDGEQMIVAALDARISVSTAPSSSSPGIGGCASTTVSCDSKSAFTLPGAMPSCRMPTRSSRRTGGSLTPCSNATPIAPPAWRMITANPPGGFWLNSSMSASRKAASQFC
jgi:hypothetical protein